MKIFIIMFSLLYLGFCAVLYFSQRALLYFPTASVAVSGATAIKFNNDGIELNGWLINPGQAQALLYYGGNAEQIEHNIPLFAELLQNYSVYLIPYRGYGNNSGQPTEAGLYQDALYIYDQLTERHSKISLMGRSLGTGVATYVATLRDVNKLVLVTPYDSVVNVAQASYWMFPVSLLLKDHYDSLRRVAVIKAKTLVLLAENDQVIKRQHSENLLAAFRSVRPESVVVTGATHNNISDYNQYTRALRAFLDNRH